MARKPASYLAGSMLLGTAIGAVVGLLTAPMAGKELRGALRRKVEEAGELGSTRLREVPDRLKTLPGASQRLAAALPEHGKRLVAKVVPGWRPTEPDGAAPGGAGEEPASPEHPPGG
ncbi:MAG: YtxH domain-containing protein [Candidatus Sericytochromatia bacterium]|nr:YtxH domain-containing protein [Candidatus Sericytochromatia bacterium]